MRTWTAAQARWAIAIYTVLVSGLAVIAGSRMSSLFTTPDSTHYLDMANGIPAALPFSSRQLGPLTVRLASHLFHMSVQRAFVVQGTLALLFFVAASGFLLVRSGAPRWTLPALGGMLFWTIQFNAVALPDVLYAALLSGFLLLLRRQHFLAAALMMFPLMVSRESTMLTLACFLIAGWRRLRVVEAGTAVAALAAGTLLVKRLAANDEPNFEHISPLMYLLAKTPWNFSKNILGLDAWADVNQNCGIPLWKMPLHLGPLHAIGYCGIGIGRPVVTLSAALTFLGLLPLLLLRLRKVPVPTGGREGILLRFCLIYGLASFVLAPTLGQSVPRLFAYSWPLFLVVLPAMLATGRMRFTSAGAAALFVALHLATSWSVGWNQISVPLVGANVALWVMGWLLLRWTFREAVGEYPADPLQRPAL